MPFAFHQHNITPPFLQAGDTVGFIAPAYHLDVQRWEPVIPLMQSWGLQVELGYSLQLKEHLFSGSDAQRLDDLVTMMCNPQIKAIFCVRGGYGCLRLLANMDSYSHAFDPKWLIGYSDITALQAYLSSALHWQSIHGPMPVDLKESTEAMSQSWGYLHSLLFGNIPIYNLSSHELNRYGKAMAPLVGGNLSTIYSLNATSYQWNMNGCILFLEDVKESLHHIDRMMTNLRISGMLSALSGLVVGAMNNILDCTPSFGQSAYEIIASHVSEYNYPVLFGFPAGHDGVNYPLVMGAMTSLEVTEDHVVINQNF